MRGLQRRAVDYELEPAGLEGYEIPDYTDFSCYVCYFNIIDERGVWPGCEWVWDWYNLSGDCIALK